MRHTLVSLAAALAVTATLSAGSRPQMQFNGSSARDFMSGEERLVLNDSATEQTSIKPVNFDVRQNYPNPFNSYTIIEYDLPTESGIYIVVYNILGLKVKTITNELTNAGTHKIQWDGRNDAGEEVASGVYFYSVIADDYLTNYKMLLLR